MRDNRSQATRPALLGEPVSGAQADEERGRKPGVPAPGDQAHPAPSGTSCTARSTRSREPVRSWISCASRASWRRPLAWPWIRRPYATCAGKWIRWSRCSARFDLAPGLAAGGRHRRGGAPPAVPLYERRRDPRLRTRASRPGCGEARRGLRRRPRPAAKRLESLADAPQPRSGPRRCPPAGSRWTAPPPTAS